MDIEEEDAFALAPARPADATSAAAAFSAADVAAAATAAVLTANGATAAALADKLIVGNASSDQHSEMWDRVASVHRLNEHFAACSSFESAEAFAGTLASNHPKLGAVLVDLLSNCDALVELVAQLMHSLCLHAEGAALLVKSGALPVLAAMLRANEPLVRAHGLTLLATLSERPSLAMPLIKAGVLKLVTFLAKTALPGQAGPASASGASEEAAKAAAASQHATWPLLLEIADGLLRTPAAVPAFQRQKLRDVLAQAAFAHKAGHLHLELPDGRRLTRLMINLRALALADPPPGTRAGGTGQRAGGVKPRGGSVSVA